MQIEIGRTFGTTVALASSRPDGGWSSREESSPGPFPHGAGEKESLHSRRPVPPPDGANGGRSPSHPPCDAGRHTPLPHHASFASQESHQPPAPPRAASFLEAKKNRVIASPRTENR